MRQEEPALIAFRDWLRGEAEKQRQAEAALLKQSQERLQWQCDLSFWDDGCCWHDLDAPRRRSVVNRTIDWDPGCFVYEYAS